jgi:hypothetical protein
VLHAIEVAGIDHVGIGSDYDGIGRTPQGLEDASCYGRLAERMRERGLAPDDVEKVCTATCAGCSRPRRDPGPPRPSVRRTLLRAGLVLLVSASGS